MICPNCGSEAQRRGFRDKKQRYQCKICKRWFADVAEPKISQKIGYEELGNRAYAVGKPQDAIPTLSSLLDSFKVDTEIWKVERWSVNQWDVSASKKVDGEVVWVTKTNYQAKANLIRKIPFKHEWMPIRGATVVPYVSVCFPVCSVLKTAVVLSDIHAGYSRDLQTNEFTPLHDEKACEIALNIIKKVKPKLVVLVGDALDLPDWSTHFLQSPEFAFTTQKSLDWLASYLREVRQHCEEMVYILGNHEARLEKAIIQNSVSAYGIRKANMPDTAPVISIPFLLGLDELDIEWHSYPSGEYWINDNLVVIHGDRFGTKSGQTVMKMLDSPRCSVICGHAHRLEQAHQTVWTRGKNVTYSATSVGTLAHIDGRVPHGGSGRMNWQQGFAIVDYGDEIFDINLIGIFNNKAIYKGEVYEPRTTDTKSTKNRT